jgi:hypothetical protein
MRCHFCNFYIVTLCITITSYCKAPELQNENGKRKQTDFSASSLKHSSGNITINDRPGTDALDSFLRILKQYDDRKSVSNNSMHYFLNYSQQEFSERSTSGAQTSPSTYEQSKRNLPVAMIIAGPTAAASIFIFLCVAYYFHNAQLNRKAECLSVTLFVPQSVNSLSSNCSSPTCVLPPPHRYIHTARLSRDSDILGPRRKSMISIHTLSLPPSIMGKRGSNWSALADQEILSLSGPRRHSTFIL